MPAPFVAQTYEEGERERREGGREGVRERRREAGREGRREREREGGREGGRESRVRWREEEEGKEGGREGESVSYYYNNLKLGLC